MPRTTACPSCGAAVRPDAPWCMLCHTDLRPKAVEPAATAPAPTAPAPTAFYGLPAGDPLTQPLSEVLGVPPQPDPPSPAPSSATWPCSLCDTVNPMTEDRCSVCKQPFLASMKLTEKPVLVLPVVGDLARMSRGGRAGVAVGLVAIVLIPLAIITLLLTGAPPKKTDTPAVTPSAGTSAPAGGGGTVTDSSVPLTN